MRPLTKYDYSSKSPTSKYGQRRENNLNSNSGSPSYLNDSSHNTPVTNIYNEDKQKSYELYSNYDKSRLKTPEKSYENKYQLKSWKEKESALIDLSSNTKYSSFNNSYQQNFYNYKDYLSKSTRVLKNDEIEKSKSFTNLNQKSTTPNKYTENKQQVKKSKLLEIPQVQSHTYINSQQYSKNQADKSPKFKDILSKSTHQVKRPISSNNIIIEEKLNKAKQVQKKSIYNRSISNSRSKQSEVTLDDFIMVKKLGQGRFGQVFMVLHKATKSLYALKKIKKQMIKSHYMQDQLMMEIKIQLYLSHPNVLKIYALFSDKQNVCLLLEYMEQGTLFSRLKKNTKLNEKETGEIMNDVVQGVKYLHLNDVAHRDIKPQNIVLSNNVAKLCDLGWAAYCPQSVRTTQCGTLDYSAPEILQGKVYGKSIDLWCLGVLAYELLVGKAPFYHISRKQTMKKIINQGHQQLKIPDNLSSCARDFIKRMIKWDPECRMNAQQALKHPFLQSYSSLEY